MKQAVGKFIFIIPFIAAFAAAFVLIRDDPSAEPQYLVGMVETTEVDVVPKIPGRVAELLVEEGATVQAGALVGTLTSAEVEAKVLQAEGALQAAQARLAMARNGARPEEVEGAERLFNQAQEGYELARKTYERIERIFAEGLISAQERDQAEYRYQSAREAMEAARARYQMVKSGARQEDIAAAEGLVQQGTNTVREAEAYRSETRLISPIAGEVARRIVDPGETVAAGYPVLTIINPEDCWIVLQVREDQLQQFTLGKVIPAVIPALNGKEERFKVSRVASMADFATWKATNQKGDYDLKTFEVTLRPVHPIKGLRPGMSARVRLDDPK